MPSRTRTSSFRAGQRQSKRGSKNITWRNLSYLLHSLIFDTQLAPLASDPAIKSGLCIPRAFGNDFCYSLWNAFTKLGYSLGFPPLLPPRSWT